MGLGSLNNSFTHFHFLCTNYGSNKDGIGHYTSKVVKELGKSKGILIDVYSGKTEELSKFELVFSFIMIKEIIKLIRATYKRTNENIIVLEYPFVEYNPLILIFLAILKSLVRENSMIVLSLHEYKRTQLLRKLFIKFLLPMADVVLYTKQEDVETFRKYNSINFKKRIIPANIEPDLKELRKEVNENELNVCFFGIVNYKTKEIKEMIDGWEKYVQLNSSNRTIKKFHFISSSNDNQIKSNPNIIYHYNLDDLEVSSMLKKIHFVILPLKPEISINNGSLAVACIHKCIPVGVFQKEYFQKGFGVSMKDYSVNSFFQTFQDIDRLNNEKILLKSELAYDYGKSKSIVNCAKSYLEQLERIN
ncbi:hypothetical protein [Aestuariibaculum lutulentum]|uniref:Glycosyltransferase family 1 protein n=1 Tax=Aestuariibaculum lutulentum TaxID=2920935 RepID=A0ABS9RGN2_9FLAO|nr:hypothetical protein [Aestuariibaculum lutulentum]MCH4552105.1 hypothetical protein [Aestuariibaculum lutulentum]